MTDMINKLKRLSVATGVSFSSSLGKNRNLSVFLNNYLFEINDWLIKLTYDEPADNSNFSQTPTPSSNNKNSQIKTIKNNFLLQNQEIIEPINMQKSINNEVNQTKPSLINHANFIENPTPSIDDVPINQIPLSSSPLPNTTSATTSQQLQPELTVTATPNFDTISTNNISPSPSTPNNFTSTSIVNNNYTSPISNTNINEIKPLEQIKPLDSISSSTNNQDKNNNSQIINWEVKL